MPRQFFIYFFCLWLIRVIEVRLYMICVTWIQNKLLTRIAYIVQPLSRTRNYLYNIVLFTPPYAQRFRNEFITTMKLNTILFFLKDCTFVLYAHEWAGCTCLKREHIIGNTSTTYTFTLCYCNCCVLFVLN